jgi:gamma-glutamylcyclotransferase (GGCT)/AIG2-like uncharacterized protein YtfP
MKVSKKMNEVSNVPEAVGIRVFVYGTLKRLHYNHETIESETAKGTEFLGACYLTGPLQMRDLTFYPGVQTMMDTKIRNRIYGEVYRVTEDTLKALDILEGNGHFFTRTQVETPWKKAWCYMIPSTFDHNRPIIGEGVWKPNAQEKAFIHGGKSHLDANDYFQLTVTMASNG